MPHIDRVAVVISGYDKYSVLWEPLKYSIDRYWTDLPWEVNFITDSKDGPKEFKTIKTNISSNWGTQTKEGLEKVGAEIILWMMDDFWLTGAVDTKYLVRYSVYMSGNPEIDHIRLLPPAYHYNDERGGGKVAPERECKSVSKVDPKLWLFKDDAPYRASATIGLWKKDIFLKYLDLIATPWEFEQKSGMLSRGNDRYLCNIDPTIFPISWSCNPYPNGKAGIVERGEWAISAYEYAKHEEIKVDFSVHPNGKLNEAYSIT